MVTLAHAHRWSRRAVGWRSGFLAALTFFALILCTPLVANDDLVPATGDVLLVIDGNIAQTNAGEEAHFDLAMLQSLPPAEFSTHTPWEDGLNHFAGALLSDVLSAVGASSTDFFAVAVDEYQVEFSGVDLERYPVLLAWEHNGEPISVRKLGPLRIMFPFDDHPELDNNANRAMAVWQLIKMSVR